MLISFFVVFGVVGQLFVAVPDFYILFSYNFTVVKQSDNNNNNNNNIIIIIIIILTFPAKLLRATLTYLQASAHENKFRSYARGKSCMPPSK